MMNLGFIFMIYVLTSYLILLVLFQIVSILSALFLKESPYGFSISRYGRPEGWDRYMGR